MIFFTETKDVITMEDTFYLRRESYEKLLEELKQLKDQKQITAKEIGEAAAQGDLKENAEYMAAKEKQSELLIKIDSLEAKLRKTQIIDDLDVDKSEARIGATVTIVDSETGNENTYLLVGSMESDPDEGKLSVKSPIAVQILGKKAGDEFEVDLPKGIRKFKLVKMEYS